MKINWFPGHMAKALRNIKENLGLVDLVLETSDARIPVSSRNPELDKVIGDEKPRFVLLNKVDLADPKATKEWVDYFAEQGIEAFPCDARDQKDVKSILNFLQKWNAERQKERIESGKGFKALRIMVVGVPNTGKSTIINTIAGRKSAETANRPGVTQGPQWVKNNDKTIELLDMPGVLWAKIESEEQQLNLAATGAIKDALLPIEEVAFFLFKKLLQDYPEEIQQRFKLDNLDADTYDLYLLAAQKRGCIKSGGKIDEERFANIFLKDFRSGKIGRISLERVNG